MKFTRNITISMMAALWCIHISIQAQTTQSIAETSTTTPVAEAKPWIAEPHGEEWLKRHESFVARSKQGKINVVFLGDSLTDSWNGQKELWEKYYAPLGAVNYGISGDRTEHVIWRIQHGELDGIQPKVIVLLIGSNNLARWQPNTGQETIRGVKEIVRMLRQKLPDTKILLLGNLPRGDDPADPVMAHIRREIKVINTGEAQMADDKNIFFLDFGDQYLKEDGSIPKELMPDFVHLSTKGYQIWADKMNPLLASIMK